MKDITLNQFIEDANSFLLEIENKEVNSFNFDAIESIYRIASNMLTYVNENFKEEIANSSEIKRIKESLEKTVGEFKGPVEELNNGYKKALRNTFTGTFDSNKRKIF